MKIREDNGVKNMEVINQKMRLLLIMLCLGISIVIIITISNDYKKERIKSSEEEIERFFYDNGEVFENVSTVLYDSDVFSMLTKQRGEPTIFSASMSEIKEYLGVDTVELLDFLFSSVSLEQIKRKANCIEYCFSLSNAGDRNVYIYYIPGDNTQIRKTIIYLEQYKELSELSEHWYRAQ